MLDLSGGIHSVDDEKHFQQWLRDHPAGFVLGGSKNRRGELTVHRVGCLTIEYDFEEKGQSGRTGKVCFGDRDELTLWVEAKSDLNLGLLNWQCPK